MRRAAWREWDERFGVELLSGDGAVLLGPAAARRLPLLRDAGVAARAIDAAELSERLPLLRAWNGPAMLDEEAGVIRTRAAVRALTGVVGDRQVAGEVFAVSAEGEVRAGGVVARHDRVVVCAGRGTGALARTAGLTLPVAESSHVRLTFPVRGDPPPRLECLQHPAGAYGDPLPGNARYAIGLGDVADPAQLSASAERTRAWVAETLPGLVPEAVEARHCWVTELPWGPDGVAVWEAGRTVFLAGGNLFKHAPVLGRALAAEALRDELRPQSQLGRTSTAAG